MPAQFTAAQQRAMAMRNARKARFLVRQETANRAPKARFTYCQTHPSQTDVFIRLFHDLLPGLFLVLKNRIKSEEIRHIDA